MWAFLMLLSCIRAFEARSFPADPADDYDRDGLSEDEGDCDDEDPLVQAITWFRDGDGDGVGGAPLASAGCVAPEDAVRLSGDCDDARADVYPGAPEVCDLVDSNCDGDLDSALVSLDDGRVFANVSEAAAAVAPENRAVISVCPGTHEMGYTYLWGNIEVRGLGDLYLIDLGYVWVVVEEEDVTQDTPENARVTITGVRMSSLMVDGSSVGGTARVRLEDVVVADGLGVSAGFATLEAERVRITGNNDVGLSLYDSDATLTDVEIDRNDSGGVDAVFSTVDTYGFVRVHHNTAVTGAGVRLRDATMTCQGPPCQIDWNDALGVGGGVVLEDATLQHAFIEANRALARGGGVLVRGDAEMVYSFVQSNTSARGGGIFLERGTLDLDSVEMMENLASESGGNAWVASGRLRGGSQVRFADGGALAYAPDLAVEQGALVTLPDAEWGWFDPVPRNLCLVDGTNHAPVTRADGAAGCWSLLGRATVDCGAEGCDVVEAAVTMTPP